MMIIKIKKDVMVRSVICNLACVVSGLRFWGRRENNERPQDPHPPKTADRQQRKLRYIQPCMCVSTTVIAKYSYFENQRV